VQPAILAVRSPHVRPLKETLSMALAPSPQYEFTQEQNKVLGDLAAKMRLVGFFLILVALVSFLLTAALVAYTFKDQLPKEMVEKIPADAYKLVPPSNQLLGIAIYSGVAGLIFLMFGMWTRFAAGGFQKVVDTSGHDIDHLMGALGSLRNMYALLQTLILIGLILVVLGLGVFLGSRFFG
jgi:hypothetical protein